MRVISGKAGRLPLKAPAGMEVRPTTDRIKETLFNILSPDIPGARFLDLFSGSGAIGIEALSRGARRAVFVDNLRASLDCIRANLEKTKLADGATVMSADAAGAVHELSLRGEHFDIIFMDPPYDRELERGVLTRIATDRLLDEDGFIVVEASAKTELDYLPELGLTVFRTKSYGSNKHIFIRYTEK